MENGKWKNNFAFGGVFSIPHYQLSIV